MIMYADDTTLFCNITETPAAEHLLNLELCKINDWLSANKLSLNVNKTKPWFSFILIRHYYILNCVLMLLKLNMLTTYFLGLQLNHNLKWNKHINYVSLKMSKITGLLLKLKSMYPTSILKSIYNTLILPNINYCMLSWGLKLIKYTLYKNELFDIFQRVSLERIRNHYVGNTICLKYKTYIIWLF